MEGKGDGANPTHQPTLISPHFKRKSPSDHHSKISQLRVEVKGQDVSKSFDGPTRLKHMLAKDAEQLKQLRASCSENQNPNQERVLDKMLASYDEAIAILNKIASGEQDEGKGALISPRPPDDSDNCSMAASACMVPSQKISKVKPMHYMKKRSTHINDVTRVRASAGLNDAIPDDGYEWRKYGQKDILGSTFPRSYYRCCHRHTVGCLATKQVQRSDEDPMIFEITNRGIHTCLELPLDREVSQSSEESNMLKCSQIKELSMPVDLEESTKFAFPIYPKNENVIAFLEDLDDFPKFPIYPKTENGIAFLEDLDDFPKFPIYPKNEIGTACLEDLDDFPNTADLEELD